MLSFLTLVSLLYFFRFVEQHINKTARFFVRIFRKHDVRILQLMMINCRKFANAND